MDIILSAPYLVKVITSLLVILLANRFIKNLSAAVVIGILVLSLWLGHNFSTITSIAWERISDADTVFLVVIIFQIIWLSSQMSRTGIMKDLVAHIRSRVSQRTAMAILPAIIGILPMPGGAIFSAPMVDEVDEDGNIEPLLKAKINYWFRHIWEFWWPLYPGVLLLLDITKLSIPQVFLIHFPLTLACIGSGYFFLLRKVRETKNNRKNQNNNRITGYVKLLYPIIIVVGGYGAVETFLPWISGLNKYLPMIAAIILSQTVLQLKRPLGVSDWKSIIFNTKTVSLIVLVCIIRIYGAFIENPLPDGTTLMAHLQTELNDWGIPVFFLIVLIPFVSGLTTGIALGYVGASIPIVMGLAGNSPGIGVIYSTVVMAYCSGYIGMILSPVHVCLVVSNEYFNSSMTRSIISLLRPALAVFTTGIVLHFSYSLLLH